MKRPARAVRADDAIPSLKGPPSKTPDAFRSVDAGEKIADAVEVFDVEQGEADWFTLRLGMPTASNFATIMASGVGGVGPSKTRAKLMRQMAGEIFTGLPAENYKGPAMQRGNDMEAELREDYSFTNAVTLTRVGFVRRTLPNKRFVGCSPDSLIDDDGVLEIKSMAPDLLIELAESGRFPSEHRAQCQGSLWVTGRSYCILRIGYTGMPITPTFRVAREDAYIKEISDAVETFDWELHKLVDRIKKMGGK